MEKVEPYIITKERPRQTEQRQSYVNSPRLDLMIGVLVKTFLACNMPLPGDDGLQGKGLVFCEDLEDIPDNELDHCFRQARLRRNDSFFPSTGEIISAWDIRAEELRRISEENKPKELPEPAPSDMARDCSEYIKRPTPAKLEALKKKYPNAGF